MTQPFDRFIINNYSVLKFAQDDSSPFRAKEDGIEMGIEYGEIIGGNRYRISPYRIMHNNDATSYALLYRKLFSSFIYVVDAPHIGLSITGTENKKVFFTNEFGADPSSGFMEGWDDIYESGKGYIFGAEYYRYGGTRTFTGISGEYAEFAGYISGNSFYIRVDTIGGSSGLSQPHFSETDMSVYFSILNTGKIHKFSMTTQTISYSGGTFQLAPLLYTANGYANFGIVGENVFVSKTNSSPYSDLYIYDMDLNLVDDAVFSSKYEDGIEFSTTNRCYLH